MIYKEDIKGLKKYRHIIACLIDNSMGYFTPIAALHAIEAHKNKQPYYCELYMDTVLKQKKYKMVDEYPADEQEHYIKVNKDFIKSSFRYAKTSSHKCCLAIVDNNINGNQSIGASWF